MNGTILLLIGCFLMGSMGTFANLITNTHPLNVVTFRYLFSLTGLLLIGFGWLVFDRKGANRYFTQNWTSIKKHPRLYLLTGAIFSLVMACYAIGSILFSVGLSVVMLYTSTLYLPLTQRLIKKLFLPSITLSNFNKWYYLSSATNLIGLILIILSSLNNINLNWFGLTAAVLSGILFSIGMVQIGLLKDAGISTEHTLFGGTVFGALLFWPALLLLPWSLNSTNILASTGLGVLATAIGGIFYFKGFGQVRADLAPLLAYTEPVAGSLLAVIILHESYDLPSLSGLLLILLTNVIYSGMSRKKVEMIAKTIDHG